MAKARVIVKRRKAVRNIKKITKVMQMIATARYQKAYKRAVGTKPYVRKIGELVASVAETVKSGGAAVSHPLLEERTTKAKRTAVLVLTSNRGLCGGYNGGVLRLAGHTLRDLEAAGVTPELRVVGKKGIAYFRFQKREMAQSYATLGDNPKFADVEPLANQFMEDFIAGKVDAVKVVYMRFLSAGTQRPGVVDLLPLSRLGGAGEAAGAGPSGGAQGQPVAYDFSPGPAELLADLIPTTVKATLFQAFIEAAVSEQIARMVAMKAATDNADKMVRRLTQDYNRAPGNYRRSSSGPSTGLTEPPQLTPIMMMLSRLICLRLASS